MYKKMRIINYNNLLHVNLLHVNKAILPYSKTAGCSAAHSALGLSFFGPEISKACDPRRINGLENPPAIDTLDTPW
jgi:hypothetical protein